MHNLHFHIIDYETQRSLWFPDIVNPYFCKIYWLKVLLTRFLLPNWLYCRFFKSSNGLLRLWRASIQLWHQGNLRSAWLSSLQRRVSVHKLGWNSFHRSRKLHYSFQSTIHELFNTASKVRFLLSQLMVSLTWICSVWSSKLYLLCPNFKSTMALKLLVFLWLSNQ